MKQIKERIEALEQGSTGEQRITRVEIVAGGTGELGFVIHIGEQPDQQEGTDYVPYHSKITARLSE